jgi:hypothetical protein
VGVLIFGVALVGIKDFAYLWGVLRLIWVPEPMRVRRFDGAYGIDIERLSGAAHAPAEFNPVDWGVARFAAAAKDRVGTSKGRWYHRPRQVVFLGPRLLKVIFTAPVAVVLAAACQFTFGPSHHDLALALGALVALCAILVLLTAVLRRLVIGPEDWKTSDVRIPTVGPLRYWAATNDDTSNLTVYFLVIVLIAIVGFASLYLALGNTKPSGFGPHHAHMSGLTAIYFSATTLATVGFGDVVPKTNLAKIAVICEIGFGPVLLSWLLSVFGAARSSQ